MKSFTLLSLLFLYSFSSFAQWSVFAGGSINLTTDCNKSGNPLTSEYYDLHYPNYPKTEHLSAGLGGGGEIGCSYLLKKHHLFLSRVGYSFQTYHDSYAITNGGMNPHGNYDYSTSYYYDKISFHYIQIPFSYGYSICKKNTSFSFTPYIGWLNQFFLTNAYFDHRYYGFLQGGLRFNFEFLYIDFAYNLLLTPYYDDAYATTRLQTVNLSLGYVYTFKTKAERQSKKE